MLTIIDYIPENFLDLCVDQLHTIFDGPTLIHLEGRRKKPLFVSVLLHGNENSGFLALKDLLKRYANKDLPRSLSVFIGNIEAAKHRKRQLNHQPDYNRIWHNGDSPEQKMVQEIINEMKSRNVFASIDIHNNTGINPHYACITKLDHRFFYLATLFSRTVVYFTKPDGTQTQAFSDICPAVTVECGLPGQAFGVEHVLNLLDAALHLDHFPDTPIHAHDIDLYHTVAVIKIPDHISFGFNSDDVAIRLRGDLDHLNFRALPVGTELAYTKLSSDLGLKVSDENNEDIGYKYFNLRENTIETKQELMPSMFTLNKEVIRQDCLGYLMERYPLSNISH